ASGTAGAVGVLVFGASSAHPTKTTSTTALRRTERQYPYLFIVLSLNKHPVPFVHHSLHGEDHAEPRLAAQHAIVGGSGLFEREGLHHGTNPGKVTKVERLFRVSGAA